MDKLKNKVAIVTGGASGIGEATAKLLAHEGARVAITDIDDINGKRVANEINSISDSAGFWHMDISNENEVGQVFRDINDTYRQLNILVNNAGVTARPGPVDKSKKSAAPAVSHDIATEEWDYVMNINLRGTFFCVKHAVPYILNSGPGSVVNVASVMGIKAGPSLVYNTSKAGIRHMTKSDALIHAKDKIRFNVVLPGFIMTPLFKRLSATNFTTSMEEQLQNLAKMIPLAKPGDPEDIANGILYFASDESRYVTGAELIIDGGFSL